MTTGSRAVLFLVAFTAVLPSVALADGKVWDGVDRSMAYETGQHAAIAHTDGMERLVIAVDLELPETHNALWAFPVPGTPDTVKPDLIDTFPDFSGVDPRQQAWAFISEVCRVPSYTLILPMLFARGGHAEGTATVHVEAEKWGMHVETLTADSPEALAEHVAAQGLDLPADEFDVFEPYMNGEWVIVLAWIKSAAELDREFGAARHGRRPGTRRPCVFVEFPTDEPFYPLRPTAAYRASGVRYMQIIVAVLGRREPVSDQRVIEHSYTSNFRMELTPAAADHPFWEGVPPGELYYTTWEYRGPTGDLLDDLRFGPDLGPSSAFAYADVVGRIAHPRLAQILGFALTLLFSFIVGAVTGRGVYGEWPRHGLVGLGNLLTLVGLLVTVRMMHPEKGAEARRRRLVFVALFVAGFVALRTIVELALLAPLR